MNSLDPWRIIATDSYGDVVWPRPVYRHPFNHEVPSWVTAPDGENRQLFDGVFIGADPSGGELAQLDSAWTALFQDLAVQAGELTRDPGGGYHYTTQAEFDALRIDPGLIAWWKRAKPQFHAWVQHRERIREDSWHIFDPMLDFWRARLGALKNLANSAGFTIHVGADMSNDTTVQRKGLVAEVAPIVAPATGGITVKKELDDKQVLRVEICVDGKCYSSSMDLAPAIAMVMDKLSRWHLERHAQMDQKLLSPPPTTAVSGAVDAAVNQAADGMVAALVGRHVETICGSFLDDIGNAVKGVASGLAGGVASTIKSLKGPISAAASVAATSGAALIPGVGPFVAPIAGKLAGDIVNSTIGDPQAQQAVAQAKQQAQTDPNVALALKEAQKAVANSTVAHHVQLTAKKAAQGHPQAQQQIANVAQSAEQGDPAAKALADLVANAMHSEWGAKLWEQVTGRGPATVSGYPAYAVIGSFWDDVKNAVLTVTGTKATNQFIKDNHLEGLVGMAGQAVATYYGGPAAGAAAKALAPTIMNLGIEDKQKAQAAHSDVQGVKAVAQQAGPRMAQAADLAHGAIEHTATAYQVAQIVKDAKAGVPQAQQALANLRAAARSGDLKAKRALHAARMINRAQEAAPGPTPGPVPAPAPAPGGPPGGSPVGQWHDIAEAVVGCAACEAEGAWHDVVGTAVDDLRERARGYATKKPGNAAGVIQMVDRSFHSRGFPSLDDAIDWLQRATSRREDFLYAAAYEKDRDGTAYIQAEEFGGGRSPAVPAEQIPRGIATVSGWY